MRTVLLLLALGVAGCDRNDAEAVVPDYASDVDAARALVDAHESAVAAAATIEAAGALEQQYMSDWESLRDQMQGDMDAIGGCQMHGDGMGMMRDADTTMGMMDDAVGDHVGTHMDHGDVTQCRDGEPDHAGQMHDMLDQMGEHGEHWMDEGMSCPGM